MCSDEFSRLLSQRGRNQNAGSGAPFLPAAYTVPRHPRGTVENWRLVSGGMTSTPMSDRRAPKKALRRRRGDNSPDPTGSKDTKYAGFRPSPWSGAFGRSVRPYRKAERATLWKETGLSLPEQTKSGRIKALCADIALFTGKLEQHAVLASLNDNDTDTLMGHLAAVFRTRVALEHRLTLLRELAPNCSEAGSEAGAMLREIAA